MTKTLLLPLLLSAAAAGAAPLGLGDPNGSYSCRFRMFTQCGDGTATVRLVDGKIQQVSFESLFCARQGRPANRCVLDTRRDGADRWTDTPQGVRIAFTNRKWAELDDVLTVSVDADRILIDFEDAQSVTKCSAGVDLPEKLTIDPNRPQCQVEY
jgi:hypothetical protein